MTDVRRSPVPPRSEPGRASFVTGGSDVVAPRWSWRGAKALWSRLDPGMVAVLVNLVVLSGTTNLMVILVSSLVDVRQSSLWFMCLSASALMFVTDMGISYALSRHLAGIRGPTAPGALGDAGRVMMRHFARIGLPPFLVLAVVLGAYLAIARGRSQGAEPTMEVVALWAMVAAYSLFAVLSKFLQMANEGLGKLSSERYIVSACQFGTFVAAIALLILFRNVWLLPLAYVAGFGLQSLLLYRSAQRTRTTDRLVTLDRDGLRSLARESRGLWFLNLATVTSQNIQVMSLAFLATPASVASFFFLQRLCGGASNLLGVIPIIDRARITAHLGRDDPAGALRRIYGNLLIAAVSTIGIAAIFVGAVLLLEHLSWLKFHIPPLLLAMFTFDLLFSTVLGIMGQYLLAAGRNPLIPWTIACSALTIGLQFVLVPRFGALGAIGAFLIAQILTTYGANLWHFIRLVRDLRQAA